MTTTDQAQPAPQPLDLRAAALTAACKADREQQADQAKRRADNAERARRSAAAILRWRLGVATSPADWTPTGDLDNDRVRSATAAVDKLSFLVVERYSADYGYQSTLYLRRPCPAEDCDGHEQAEVGSLEALGWLLRASGGDGDGDGDGGSHRFTCRACDYRTVEQREAARAREAAAATEPDEPPPLSAAEVLTEALRALIREETSTALQDHQTGWQHQGDV